MTHLPVLRNTHFFAETHLSAKKAQAIVASAPKCDDCFNCRVVTLVRRLEDMEHEYDEQRVRMCAHPSVSHLTSKYSEGVVTYTPQFGCDVMRENQAFCGPEGNLYVPRVRTLPPYFKIFILQLVASFLALGVIVWLLFA